jgi:hypothetical protein
VKGDIAAPRVVLEDGAHFRGGVDMGDLGGAKKPASGATAVRRPSEAGKAPEPVEVSGPRVKSGAEGSLGVSR